MREWERGSLARRAPTQVKSSYHSHRYFHMTTFKASEKAGVSSFQPSGYYPDFPFSGSFVVSNIWGRIRLLIDRSSLLRKAPGRQLMSESINLRYIFQYQWIKHTSLGASIDVSMQSVLHNSWPGLLARGHDSEFKRSPKSLIHRQNLIHAGNKRSNNRQVKNSEFREILKCHYELCTHPS